MEDILAVDGVDAIFLGPSDLAASMGLLGQQEHPEVRAAVEHCLAAATAAGKPAGVNAFNPATARRYLAAGAAFVLVGADVPSWPAAPRPSPPNTSRPGVPAADYPRQLLTPPLF